MTDETESSGIGFEIEQSRRELSEAYRRLFSSEDGRMVLDDLIERTGMFRGGVSETPHFAAYNEGCRATAIYILERIEETTSGRISLLLRAGRRISERHGERYRQ